MVSSKQKIQREKFKDASRKCKGKSDYKDCMKKELRRGKLGLFS